MRRSILFLAAATAFGLATAAYGQTSPSSPGPQPSDQAAPAAQQPMPPGSESSATAASGPSAQAATRLAAIVPSGMTSEQACAEFSSLEQCATALHLAQNLNIPFTDLKSKLKSGERVSAIIHDAKPQADPKLEISRAQDQARADLGPQPQG
jgi:hypothetical protein